MLFRGLVVAIMVALMLPMESNGKSYWIVYEENEMVAEECLDYGVILPETCCTMKEPQGFINDFFSENCFVIRGLLEGDLALQSYLGCDSGVSAYGEACWNNGVNGGIIPNGTMVDDFNATDIEECGCQFIIMGNGCHKIRDFNTLPGFENDTRQVFILLNETCEEETFEPTQAPSSPTDSDSPAPPTSTETPTSAAIEKSVSTALLRFAVTVIVVMFAV